MSQKALVIANLSLAALFCAALGLMILSRMVPGEALWIWEMGSVAIHAFEVAPTAALSVFVLPILVALVCLACLGMVIGTSRPRTIRNATLAALVAAGMAAAIALILLRDVPIIAIALVPLAYALRAADPNKR